MSAGHTPAPWVVDEVRSSSGRAFRIGAGEMLVAGKGCCIIYDDYPGSLDNERAANARLIAAAPELLEALIEVSKRCGPMSKDGEMARAAIAKATGAA